MRYFFKAFTNHWNLLFVFATAASGFIFGVTDAVLPMLGAAEILYVSVQGTRPAFRQSVDPPPPLTDKTSDGEKPAKQKILKLNQMLAALTNDERKTFDLLKERCADLFNIAHQIKADPDFNPQALANIQFGGINRLLWIYLKLLYAKNALDRFFKTTDTKDIENRITQTQQRLQSLGPESNDSKTNIQRRKSLTDTLNTLELRRKNYQAAREKQDFVELELERLYSKISGLAEMGINRQDPHLISGEIDVVANSVQRTELTMNQLETLTGISFDDKEPPVLLRDSRVRV